MNGAFYVGAIGLDSQQRALDNIANNIANINTPAFKRSDMRFTELMASRINEIDVPTVNRSEQMVPAGVLSKPEFRMLDQGDLRETGRAGDIAINGAGFIELLGPSGQVLLWRGGSLKVNDEGMLSASNDMPLRASITMPADATDFRISSDGRVFGTIANQGSEIELGQINLIKLDDTIGVERLDGGLYALTNGAKATESRPGEEGVGLLVQGSIESSNVDLTTEMVQLTLVQRAFASNAQILQAADQLMAITNGLRR